MAGLSRSQLDPVCLVTPVVLMTAEYGSLGPDSGGEG